MLDVDGIPLPACTSVLNDPADAARALLDLLAAHAPELEGVTAIVQFSSSGGLDELAAAEAAAGLPSRWHGVAKRGVAAHVWLWLQKPVGEAACETLDGGARCRWLETRPVNKPHGTAALLRRGDVSAAATRPTGRRRTVLVDGWADAAELRIPDAATRGAYAAGDGRDIAYATETYESFLAAIGGANGFRAPMLRAVLTFIAVNWPASDVTVLKADIRARIKDADPGGRSDATLEMYAGDTHLDQMIAWAREREQENRDSAKATAERPLSRHSPTAA